jgi:hypothetical protein
LNNKPLLAFKIKDVLRFHHLHFTHNNHQSTKTIENISIFLDETSTSPVQTSTMISKEETTSQYSEYNPVSFNIKQSVVSSSAKHDSNNY